MQFVTTVNDQYARVTRFRPNSITLSSSLSGSQAGLRPASELLASWIA